ncbi:sodium-dependent low-affinity dicarboxylate transporter 1-like [Dermacentor andersoni]|uniref:sodium-dependent low-affinity dicarboxylate transporter 1-like n=1 Tax=Dermacentor andersoni TaxID=34620 RepID=UPI002415D106|nr:sodium-dependent low-affinity dicarboxylate transporter 1-like [Dermacentor andersoni]
MFVRTVQPIKCIYIMTVMIMLWIFEPVPYQITSFFPLIMGPMLNLTTTRYLAKYYFNEPIASSIAGLTVALIAQNCGLNRRLSYNLILIVGPRVKWLMLSFMGMVFFLSMFISNVAVTSMMMTVVDTLIYEISQSKLRKRVNELLRKRENQGEEPDYEEVVHIESVKSKQLRKTFLLSIGYSATLGGFSFITGNRINNDMSHRINRDARDQLMTPTTWALYCFPVGMISMLMGWVFLYTVYLKEYEQQSRLDIREVKEVVRDKLQNMPRTHAEVLSTFLFCLCLFLWATKRPVIIPGWSDMLGLEESYVTDSSVGFLIALIAFMIPVRSFNFSLEHRLMEWKFIQKNMPWAIIFIIGGGSTLTEVIRSSSLFSDAVNAASTAKLHPVANLVVAVFMSSIISEFTNAEMTIHQILDIAERKQRESRTNALYYMLPMGLANNFAFILPSSEAWNAIVFEIGGLSVIDMIIPGLFMKAVSLVLSMLSFFTTGVVLFQINEHADNMSSFNVAPLQSSRLRVPAAAPYRGMHKWPF